jgi:hypothetical protein
MAFQLENPARKFVGGVAGLGASNAFNYNFAGIRSGTQQKTIDVGIGKQLQHEVNILFAGDTQQ